MQEHYEEATLASAAEIPDARWPPSSYDTQQWSGLALDTHRNMLKLHDKSHKLFSDKHDSEALIAIDLNGRCGSIFLPIITSIEAKFPYPPLEYMFPLEMVISFNPNER